jgi:hypothetical protein
MSARSNSRLALPFAAALLLTCAPPAAAQEEPSWMQRALGHIGVLQLPGEDIDYRERAPLVVPPEGNLPAPRNPQDISKNYPDWPVDQEIVRKRKKAERDRIPSSISDEAFFYGRLLPQSELRRGTAASGTASDGPSSSTAGAELASGRERYSPSELGFRGWFTKEKPMVFTEEPARTRLTEPPAGYRTPSPNAPYGVVEKKGASGISSVFDRLESPGAKSGQ